MQVVLIWAEGQDPLSSLLLPAPYVDIICMAFYYLKMIKFIKEA